MDASPDCTQEHQIVHLSIGVAHLDTTHCNSLYNSPGLAGDSGGETLGVRLDSKPSILM